MISAISSANNLGATRMYEQHIQALDSQITRHEAQITGLQDKILEVQENEELSPEEKKECIDSIQEQITKIRDRISDIREQIAETRNKQIKAEDEARKRQQTAEARAQQTRPEGTSEERALRHSIIGIDQKAKGLNAAKEQLSSRLREAEQEDLFRVKADGGLEIIQREDRRHRDPVEAKNAQNRLDRIDSTLLGGKGHKPMDIENAGEDQPRSNRPLQPEETFDDRIRHVREEQRLEKEKEREKEKVRSSGTGRMEPGQFLEDEA